MRTQASTQQHLQGQTPSVTRATDVQQPPPATSDLGQQDALMLYVPHTELGKRLAPASAEQAFFFCFFLQGG